MRTHIIEGKPLEDVTIKVDGQSLTLTAGVEVTIIVVVASQQSVQADGGGVWHCICGTANNDSRKKCRLCESPRR